MSEDEISQKVEEITENKADENEQVTALILAMIEFSEERFEKVISKAILKFGFERTVEEIIYPFFRKIGVMWQTGSINPIQEHFISNLVRQKVIVAIDNLIPNKISNPKTFVLFLPNNELHELSLLYYYYKIKLRGHRVIYLGQSVPFEDLETTFHSNNPDFMLTIFTHEMKDLNLQEYINRMSRSFHGSQSLVSGFQLMKRKITYPRNITLFREPSDLNSYIES
ncbi:MAG: hypothetical protein Fur0041_12480 [Bacteroidia bacterium]